MINIKKPTFWIIDYEVPTGKTFLAAETTTITLASVPTPGECVIYPSLIFDLDDQSVAAGLVTACSVTRNNSTTDNPLEYHVTFAAYNPALGTTPPLITTRRIICRLLIVQLSDTNGLFNQAAN